jgi:single-stranded DNA-binding protein
LTRAAALRRAKNEADAAASDASIAEAREKFGEVEVFDRQVEKAQHYARIGDMVRAGSQADSRCVQTNRARMRAGRQHRCG